MKQENDFTLHFYEIRNHFIRQFWEKWNGFHLMISRFISMKMEIVLHLMYMKKEFFYLAWVKREMIFYKWESHELLYKTIFSFKL